MRKLGVILLVVFLSSCGITDAPKKPSATGKAGELLLIMDKEYWKGEAGDTFRSVFKANYPMFPQPEPIFDVVQIEKKAFKSIFENHRHIFIAEIKPDEPKARIEASHDVWSYPQMVIKVIAPDIESFNKTISANADVFIDYYIKKEFERINNANARIPNHEIINTLKKKFGIKMTIPQGFYIAKEEDSFLWIRRTGTNEDLDMSILLTIMPYKSSEYDFAFETIWERRDSITKTHIPGQFPDTYMTTYPDIPPLFNEINFNGNYAVKAEGLWRVAGDFMGGPFMNYTLVNNNKLINLDAYIYYPNKDKRDFMRQLQAVIHSIEFVSKEESQE